MLVLSREPGEWIDIGPDIAIQVLSCGDGKVRIGIEAPSHVAVWRRELKERMEQEQIREQKAEGKDAD